MSPRRRQIENPDLFPFDHFITSFSLFFLDAPASLSSLYARQRRGEEERRNGQTIQGNQDFSLSAHLIIHLRISIEKGKRRGGIARVALFFRANKGTRRCCGPKPYVGARGGEEIEEGKLDTDRRTKRQGRGGNRTQTRKGWEFDNSARNFHPHLQA